MLNVISALSQHNVYTAVAGVCAAVTLCATVNNVFQRIHRSRIAPILIPIAAICAFPFLSPSASVGVGLGSVAYVASNFFPKPRPKAPKKPKTPRPAVIVKPVKVQFNSCIRQNEVDQLKEALKHHSCILVEGAAGVRKKELISQIGNVYELELGDRDFPNLKSILDQCAHDVERTYWIRKPSWIKDSDLAGQFFAALNNRRDLSILITEVSGMIPDWIHRHEVCPATMGETERMLIHRHPELTSRAVNILLKSKANPEKALPGSVLKVAELLVDQNGILALNERAALSDAWSDNPSGSLVRFIKDAEQKIKSECAGQFMAAQEVCNLLLARAYMKRAENSPLATALIVGDAALDFPQKIAEHLFGNHLITLEVSGLDDHTGPLAIQEVMAELNSNPRAVIVFSGLEGLFQEIERQSEVFDGHKSIYATKEKEIIVRAPALMNIVESILQGRYQGAKLHRALIFVAALQDHKSLEKLKSMLKVIPASYSRQDVEQRLQARIEHCKKIKKNTFEVDVQEYLKNEFFHQSGKMDKIDEFISENVVGRIFEDKDALTLSIKTIESLQ